MKSSIIYAGNFIFPEGNAAAFRVYGISRALEGIGYRVLFYGNNNDCRKEDKKEGHYYYKGFRYLGRDNKTKLKVKKYLEYEYLIPLIEEIGWNNIKAIITYHFPAIASLRLTKFCQTKGILHITDTTEWYHPKQTKRGVFGPSFYDSEMRVRYANKKSDGIIVISTYLENYYKNRGYKVIRVPPLIDIKEDKWQGKKNDGSYLRFVYVGVPGKKDLIAQMVDAFYLLGKKGPCDCRLTIGGVTEAELAARDYKTWKKITLSNNISIAGVLDHCYALNVIKRADFSFLLRPKARYSMAGFPTKIVESLACGTPAIVNDTSDIKMYIRDNENGVILKEISSRYLINKIADLSKLGRGEKERMNEKAKITAKDAFDWRNWQNSLKEFILTLS